MGQSVSTKTATVTVQHLNMKTATFALGCFWHSEAMFGCQKGVHRTHVGYTGGSLKNPTYHNLGDHTEAVEIDYDPALTSYENLLKVFWQNHDPTIRHKRQYRSAIFYRNEEEKSIALNSKKEAENTIGKPVVTDIELFDKLFKAEDYHQKYYLQTHHKNLFKSLGIKEHDLVNSEVATKLNGFVVGLNTVESFNSECQSLGLSPENIEYIQKQIAKGPQSHC